MNQIDALRIQTTALITHFPALESDGNNLKVYRPPALVSDGQGGTTIAAGSPTQLPDVKRYLGKVHDPAILEPSLVPEIGSHYTTTYVLIGEYTDDFRVRDYFQRDGFTHVIVAVDPDKRFQCKGTCGRKLPQQVVTESLDA